MIVSMDIKITKATKNEVDLTVNNVTIAELLRVYLNQEGADFAVWRREHPSSPAIMKITSSDKTVKKVVGDAVQAIKKDCNKIVSAIKSK